MRHSALRRIIGLLAVLAFLAVPLNAGLMLPMAMQAAIAAVASGGDGTAQPCEGCEPLGGYEPCDHGRMAAHDCMAMCAGSPFMLPLHGAITVASLSTERLALRALERSGVVVSPEPPPPKLSP